MLSLNYKIQLCLQNSIKNPFKYKNVYYMLDNVNYICYNSHNINIRGFKMLTLQSTILLGLSLFILFNLIVLIIKALMYKQDDYCVTSNDLHEAYKVEDDYSRYFNSKKRFIK